MKHLILLRHAKSEDPALFASDFKRKLKEKGIKDILKIAAHWSSFEIPIDLVLCSDAVRTKETFAHFSKATLYQGEVKFLHELYHASASEIFDVIKENSKNEQNILLVGHNFGISNLADQLSVDGCRELPTSGMAVLAFENSPEPRQGKLIHYLTPKSI